MAGNTLSYEVAGIDRLSKILDKIADATERLNGKLDKLDGKVARVVVAAETAKADKDMDATDRKRKDLDGKSATVKVKGDVDNSFVDATNRVALFMRNLAMPVAFVAAASAVPTLMDVTAAAAAASQSLLLLPAAGAAAAVVMGTLKVATSGFGDAMKSVMDKDPAKFNKAIADLAPNARATAVEIRGLRPELMGLRDAVQDRFFAGFAAEVDQAARVYLPVLRTRMVEVAGSTNEAVLSVLRFVRSAQTVSDVDRIFTNTGSAVRELAPAGRDVVQIFRDIAVVGSEFLPGLASSVSNLTGRWRDFIGQARVTGDLKRWIQGGIDALKDLFSILGDVGVIAVEVFQAANRNGAAFLDRVHELTSGVREFVTSAEGQRVLNEVFSNLSATIDNLRPGFTAILSALRDVISQVAPKLPGVADSFSRIAEKVAPILAQITISVFDALALAFDVISRVPAPVLVAAAALFVGMAGLTKAAAGIKAAETLFSSMAGASTHVSTIRDKFKDIFSWLTGKGRLKDVLLGDDGCSSTRACLDDIDKKTKGVNAELDKTKKKGGIKGALLGAGAAAAGLGVLTVAADELLPEADPMRAGNNPMSSVTDYLDQARQDLSDFADFLRGVFTDPIGEVKLQWTDFWGELSAAPGDMSAKLGPQFTGMWTDLKTTLSEEGEIWKEEWNTLWSDVGTALSEEAGLWVDDARTGWNGLVTTLTEEGQIWKDGWNTFWTDVGTALSEEANLWIEDARTGWNGLVTTLTEEGQIWKDGWNTFWTDVGTTISTKWEEFKTTVRTKWDELKVDALAKWETYKADWDAFWTNVGTTISTKWEEIKTTARTKWDEHKADALAKWETYKADWNNFWSNVWTTLSTKWEEIKTTARAKWDEHKADADGKWATYRVDWSNMWTTVQTFFSQKMEEFKATARNAWDTVRTTVWDPMIAFVTQTIPDAFRRGVDFIGQQWARVRDIVREPINAAVRIIYTDGIQWVFNRVAEAVNISTRLPNAPGFAAGGEVTGGTAGKDSVPILAMPGEWVFSKAAVDGAGGPRKMAALQRALAGGVRGGDGAVTPDFLPASGGALPLMQSGGSPAGASGSGSASTVATGSVQATTNFEEWWSKLTDIAGAITGRLGNYPLIELLVGTGRRLATAVIDWGKQKIQEWLASLVSLVGGAAPPPGSGAVVAQVQQAANAFGWGGGAQWAALSWIISHESGWNPNAQNPTSTAYGLFQFLNGTWGSVGGSKTSNPYQQAVYGMRYIQSRYRDPLGAQAFWQCLTLNAMILTRRGWLTHEEVQVGDETIGYNPATGRSQWTPVLAVHRYDDAPIVELRSNQWHATSTPNHRWVARHWTQPVRGGRSVAVDKFVTTDRITTRHTLRLAAEADTGPGPGITLDEAALLGWIMGDGTVTHTGGNQQVRIYQNKQRGVDALSVLVKDLPHSHYVYERRGGLEHQWYLRRGYGRDLLARSGYDHHDPRPFVLSLSTEQRTAFLDGVFGAEGWEQPVYDRSSSKRVIAQADGPKQDAIILAAYLTGHRPAIHRETRAKPHHRDKARILLARPYAGGESLTRTDAGRAPAWCVTTGLGSWTAQQDGQVFLTGNSHGWYANGGIVDRPTFGLLGEAGPEVVLPLSRPDRAANLAQRAGVATSGGDFHVHVSTGPTASAEQIIRTAMFQARLQRMSGRAAGRRG